jgi:phosphoglucomutase
MESGRFLVSDSISSQVKTHPYGSIEKQELFINHNHHMIWIQAWLSIIASRNPDASKPLVSVEDIVKEHWTRFGRNLYTRYDYEEVDTKAADQVMAHLISQQKDVIGKKFHDQFEVSVADEFEYRDQFDNSVSSHQV